MAIHALSITGGTSISTMCFDRIAEQVDHCVLANFTLCVFTHRDAPCLTLLTHHADRLSSSMENLRVVAASYVPPILPPLEEEDDMRR